jgi:hypothetical protein
MIFLIVIPQYVKTFLRRVIIITQNSKLQDNTIPTVVEIVSKSHQLWPPDVSPIHEKKTDLRATVFEARVGKWNYSSVGIGQRLTYFQTVLQRDRPDRITSSEHHDGRRLRCRGVIIRFRETG